MYDQASSLLLCFTLLLAIISAAPTKDLGKSFKVHRHAIGPEPKNGVMMLEKAYRRRNWTRTAGLSTSVPFREAVVASPVHSSTTKEDVAVGGGGNGVGIVSAKAYATNTEYLCPVKIGEQTLNMDLDTGSADL